MLVLSRKVGGRIHIGENVVVQVLEIKGNQVRIGIAAPRDVLILRDEVKDRDKTRKEHE